MAMAVILGIGAGLMLRSLSKLQQVDPGFDAPRVLAFRLQTNARFETLTDGLPYFDQVVARIRALPGVTHVGAIQHLPMTGYSWTTQVWRPEQPPTPGATPASTAWASSDGTTSPRWVSRFWPAASSPIATARTRRRSRSSMKRWLGVSSESRWPHSGAVSSS
jgi:hypothetical protein